MKKSLGAREKVFSYQRNAPEDLHDKAKEELRRIFAGKEEYTIDVYGWSVRDIRSHLES